MINNFPIPLNPTKGGTGLTSVTTGSLLYGSSTNVWSQLSIGSTGQVLQVSSGVPSWSSDIAGVGTGRTIYGGIASGTLTLLSSGDVSNYGSLSLSPGGATITGNLYSVLVATTGELKYVRSGLTKLHVEGEIKTGVTGMMVSSDATLTPTRMLEVRSTSAQQRWSYDASNYADLTVSSGGHISILGNAGSQLAIGYGATAAGTGFPIAIGSAPSAGGTSAIAIGRIAAAGNPGAIAIGASAAANNDYSVAIGNSSSAAGSESVAIGRSAATGSRGVAIGYLAVTTGFTYSVALGYNAAATANNQFVSGSDGFPISNVHFGDGVVSATPTAWTLNGTGGSGTDISGADLIMAPGRPSGAGNPGNLLIQFAPAGASGTTLRTLATYADWRIGGLMLGTSGAAARMLEVRSTSAQQRWSYNATYYWEIAVASGDHLTISHPSRSNYAGDILIGSNVTGIGGSSNPAIAIGNNSTASAVNTIALGKNASATTSNGGIAIGPDTITTGAPTGSIAIGRTAIARSVNAPGVAIGNEAALNNAGVAVAGGVLVGAWTAAAVGYAIAIGTGAQVTGTGGIAIGCDQAVAGNSTIAPANTMVCGSVGYPCANVFWGKGRTTHATPTAVTLNGTGGSGTNIAGGALQIAGGKGTGNAAGGSVKIQASTAGASGTTLQTLATVAEFGPATIGFYGVTPVARPAAYTQTYSTADRTLSAYTADNESVAYTGAGDGEAQLADLNALRTAYENLRAFVEDIAQMLNSVTDDLQAVGLLQ